MLITIIQLQFSSLCFSFLSFSDQFMSSLKFNRKLLPATKAWKSFTSTLQKKLHKLKRSKAIKKTTKHLSSILGKNQSKSSSPPRFSSSTINKNRSKSPRYRSNKKRVFLHLHQHNQHQHIKQSYAPVYIDQLFKEPITVEHQQPKVPKLVMSTKGKAIEESTSTSTTLDLEQLHGVDERAEEFINKFKEEMRLQRQRSFGEYKEMLERGVN